MDEDKDIEENLEQPKIKQGPGKPTEGTFIPAEASKLEPEEGIIDEKFQTTSIPHQAEKMEVHHHPDIHHRRKKFREYFLEF
jgi:hypothetical protein